MRAKLLNFPQNELNTIRDLFPGITIIIDSNDSNYDVVVSRLPGFELDYAIRILKIAAKSYHQEYVENPEDPLEI